MLIRKTFTLIQEKHGSQPKRYVREYLTEHFPGSKWQTLELTADSPYVLVVRGRDGFSNPLELIIEFYDEVSRPTDTAHIVATVCGLFMRDEPRDLRAKILNGFKKFNVEH